MDVHDPKTSIEYAIKNLLLLEDHLLSESMMCGECVIKHWLAAEAYLTEAASLSRDGRFSGCVDLAAWLAGLRAQLFDAGGESADYAQAVRQARKACIQVMR